MALFAILWVLSPLVLIPVLISSIIKNNNKDKRIGELEAQVRRLNTKPLNKVEPVVREDPTESKPLPDKPAEVYSQIKPAENVSVAETLKQQMSRETEEENRPDIKDIEPVVTNPVGYGYEL